MKKYIFMAVAGMLALSSCSNDDNDLTEQNAPRQMTFTAGFGDGAQTRTSIAYTYDDVAGKYKGKVSFDANDEISILSAKNTNTQFTTSAGGASATFSGTATDDSKFYAVYPYTAGLTLSGDVISGIEIPTSQWNSGWNSNSNYSGWDPNAPIAYATTTGSSLTFHNACAILKVTFPEAWTYGRFTISANQPLAGTFSLDTSTGTLTPTSGSTTVTVGNPSDIYQGINVDFSGKTVYVAIAPGNYTGFNLHIYNEDGDDKSKTKSTSVTFEAGKIYDLGSYDLDYL